MTKGDAKKVSLHVGQPRTRLILFDGSGHVTLDYAVIRFPVQCGTMVIIGEIPWYVIGWGPIDDTDCNAICRLDYPP